jgi:dihydrofolate reductase
MINLIACIDLNCGLGFQNDLLIKLKNDMKYFKELTTGQFVVQGRKTFESIGHPLPNRHNIILTKNLNYKAPVGTYAYHSLEDIIHEYKQYNDNQNELFFIGGEEIFIDALPFAERIHLTVVKHAFDEVDTYFPRINPTYWKAVSHIENKADKDHPYDYNFVTFERRFNQK